MNKLIEQLRAGHLPPAAEIILHLEQADERNRLQQSIMDKAASILLEGTVSEDGIDPAQADACIDQIRGIFNDIGQTTVEHNLGLVYAKVAEIAGIPPDDEFNILTVLDTLQPGPGTDEALASREDSSRLDALEHAGGFMRGTDGGAPAFRIFGRDTWHDSLRAAIDKGQQANAVAAVGAQ